MALTRDYDTLQATYRELLSKSENSKMAASLEQRQIGEQFRLLDPPRVPLKPASPNRIRSTASPPPRASASACCSWGSWNTAIRR